MSWRVSSFGVAVTCHAPPPEDSTRLWAWYEPSSATPTAHTLPGVAAMPNSVLKFGPESGTGVTVHRDPSKCAAVASVASELLVSVSGRKLPTAHTSRGETASTAP